MKQYIFLSLILFLNIFDNGSATLSENFRAFLHSRYGEDVDGLLSRKDMGGGGSFGGGTSHVIGQQTGYFFLPIKVLKSI